MTVGLRTHVLTALLACLLALPAAAQLPTSAADGKSAPPQPDALPDLQVESIWLSTRCRLGFVLINAGKGGLTDGDYADTEVEVRVGKVRKVITLKSVDPGTVLVKAGGRVKYATNITVDTKRTAYVTVDPGDGVKESKENNNVLRSSLDPACGKAVLPSGGPGKSAASAKMKAAEPELSIERAYLAANEVRAVLVSRGPLPEGRYRQGKLQLAIPGMSKTWPLTEVDPERTLQRRWGGKVDFATGISLRSPENVLVSVTDPDQGEGDMVQVRLVPERMNGAPGRSVLDVRKPSLAEPVLFYEDYGIRILRPFSGETFWLEEPFAVTYRFSDSVDAGETVFRLSCDGRELAATSRRDAAQHPAGPAPGSGPVREVRRLEWELPGDLPGGERCIVEAVHGAARGLSSHFSLGSAAAFAAGPLVKLIDPGGGEWLERETTQTVKWRVYNVDEERGVGGWRFGIHRAGEPVRISYILTDYRTRPIRPGVMEFTWNWNISRDVPLVDDFLARIEEILPALSPHELLSDASDRTFRVRSRFQHDLEVTDIYIDSRDQLAAEITEHEGPLVGNVRILVERGTSRGAPDPAWETLSSRTVQVTLALPAGEAAVVDLGAADIPSAGLGESGARWYRVTVDSEDWVGEHDERNNALTREVY